MRWWLVVVAVLVVSVERSGAAPFAWLAHSTTDHVARVDLATHETVSVAVGTQPISTAASLDGRRAYSNSGNDSTVSVIDAPTVSVIATVPVASSPTAIVARPDAAKASKLRTVARNQILARCAGVTPVMLGLPCDPDATTMAETADCVLDAQVTRIAQALAAEYGASCGVATAAGLVTRYPGLCSAP